MNLPPTAEREFVFVALGSNQGNSLQILQRAIERVEGYSDLPVLKSSFWETTPMNCPPGSPKFINAMIGFVPRPNETPESLLEKLQGLEQEFGRGTKKVLNEARTLDLDIIAFGHEKRDGERLVLPHPRAHLRRFVLQPLSEIAPDFVLPGQSKSVVELLRALPDDDGIRRIN